MKHTQAKWFVRKSEPTSHRKIYTVMFQGKRRELMIARCGGNEEEATLIASAPEMLEALKNAEGVVRLASPSMAGTIKELVDKAEGK